MENIKRRRKTKRLSLLEDYDQDGVPNFDDCRPLDPTMHVDIGPSGQLQHLVSAAQAYAGGATPQQAVWSASVKQMGTVAGKYYGPAIPKGAAPPRRKIDPGVLAAQERTTAKYAAKFKVAEKWNIALGQGRVYFDRWGIKRIAATKERAASLGGEISPFSAAGLHMGLIEIGKRVVTPIISVSKGIEKRVVTPATDISREIGRDIKDNIARVGIDIQREVRAPKRPLEERMLFGGFIGKGERVGRLTVAPTLPRVGLERMEVTPVREAKRVEFAPTIPFVSDIHTKLTAMYRGIKPPPEVQAYEGRIGELEVGLSAFETKWEPYVRGEQFIGTEVQYQRMLKEHAVLERRVTPVEEAQRGLMEPQYLKAERKLKGYKTGWIYAGSELALEWYGRKVLQAQEAVAGWQREIGYKPSERPWLGPIEHAQWYTAKELPGMVLRGGAMIPPALEAALFKEPEKMQAAIMPGLAFMGKGMVEEARREPLGFAETMGISMLAPKAAARVSPIKYMEMKVPTGKSLVKTWTTIGKGMPSEFKMLKEVAGPRTAIELGKIEPTWVPGIYKQTHLIPEMVTYRGLRASLPSAIPYKGKAPLVGVVTRPPGKRPTQMVTPEEYAQHLITEGELGGVFTWRMPKEIRSRMKEEGLGGYISHLDIPELEKLMGESLQAGYMPSEILRDLKSLTRTGKPHEIYISPESYLGRLQVAKPILMGLRRGVAPQEIMAKAMEIGYGRPRQQILAHELYHYKYPKKTEAQIIALEKEFGVSPTKKVFEILDAPVKRREFVWGTPEFEMPAQFRVFTAPEARLVMPSMRKMLKGEELAAWESAMYLQEIYGRKRPLVREPIRIGELEHLKEAFGSTEGLVEFTQYMQKHRRQMLIYGSAAKRAQMAREELITPKDIDIEITSMAARLSALTTETKVPFRSRLMPFEVELAHRVSRRMPGLRPEQVAADLAAISKKYLGEEHVQVSFKPAWQMFSVEKTLKTMEKTQWGLESEVMTLADIHPPSGPFEFGLKPQRPIKVPVISGLPGEKIPLIPKRVRITPLGEEFERGFGSIIQLYERRGVVSLGPRPTRIKDIARFVQTGKMLIETERLRAELGLGVLRSRRMRRVERGREALEIWEKRALREPELREVFPAVKAEAILPGMESVLKQQMRAQSLILSERAALGYSEMLLGGMPRQKMAIPKPKRRVDITEQQRLQLEDFFGKEPPKTDPLYWEAQHKKYRGMDVDVRLDTKHLDRLNAALEDRLVSVCSGHTHPTEWGGFLSDVPEIGIHYLRGKHLARRIQAMRGIPGMKVKGGKGFVTIKGLKKGTPEWWEGTTAMIEQLAITKRFKRTPFKSVEDILREEGRIRETAPIVKEQLSYMMAERVEIGPGYKARLPEVECPIEISKAIDTSAYYPKMKRVVPSDYYPKAPLPIDSSSYYTQKMLPISSYDYYPKPVPAYGDSDYYGMPMYKHVAKRGVPTPFIGMIPTAFVPFGVPTVSIMPVFKPTPVPKMITGAPMPTTTFVPPPTGFFVPPPGVWVPPPTGWTPPPPPPTTIWTPPPPPPPTTIWTPPPPPPPPPTTIWVPPPPPPPTYIFPLLPSEEKPRRRKKKYKFEEVPWKEKHYIPTLRELMRPIPGMKVPKPMDFEPKMPKFPKGIM